MDTSQIILPDSWFESTTELSDDTKPKGFESVQIPQDINQWVQSIKDSALNGQLVVKITNLCDQGNSIALTISSNEEPGNAYNILAKGGTLGLFLSPQEARALGKSLLFASRSFFEGT